MQNQNENNPMVFNISTTLGTRKLAVDGVETEFTISRYVDLDPMIFHVKAGDKLIFRADTAALTVTNLPGLGEAIIPAGGVYEYIVPELEEGTRVKLPLFIKGENLAYKEADEDPELIYDPKRP